MPRLIAHRCVCIVVEKESKRKKSCNRYGRRVSVKGLLVDMEYNLCSSHRKREAKNYEIVVLR